MNLPFIFTSGLIVAILFLIGVLYTWEEFKAMENKPEEHTPYEDEDNDPKVVDEES